MLRKKTKSVNTKGNYGGGKEEKVVYTGDDVPSEPIATPNIATFKKIAEITNSYDRADICELREKINEIIKRINA